MAKAKLPVTYALGRRDRVDPKLAPFGVLKVGQNLRVRKDGRLVMRRGYAPLPMTTRNGTLVAYDIHEYKGRLCALGSDSGEGFPTDLFEYTGLSDAAWRATDRFGRRVMLNPITNLREVAGIPQPNGGVQIVDAAVGGGYSAMIYQPEDSGRVFVLIVEQTTDQVVHFESLTEAGHVFSTGGLSRVRLVYSGGTFYIGGVFSSINAIRIARFTVGTNSIFATLANPVVGFSPAVTGFDFCPVTNATTARLVVAYAAAGDVEVITYNSGGAVLDTISLTADVTHLAIEADEADDTLNLLTVESGAAQLRTYDFAGSLLDGPTSMGTGASAFLGRLPAQTGFAEHVAVAVNTSAAAVELSFVNVDTHATTDDVTVQRAVCKSRLLSAQSANQPMAALFSGLVGPDLVTFERATNALFFVTPDVAHMASRDFTRARSCDPVNLSRDATTGKLCWAAARDPGVDVAMPVITLADLQSTERRQSANYGGLIYFSGSAPTVYDGRLNGELGFSELPGILSATPSNGSGALAADARYFYIYHWEYVLADGSVEQGPVTEPFEATTGSGQDTMAVVVTAPHTVRLAAGDGLFGANVVGVLSRTQWDPVTRTAGSTYRRCAVRNLGIGMANYGEDVTITDLMSDTDIATQTALYTQAARGALSGPLEHNAPRACSYITATEARLLTGGLSRECDVQISKAAFYGEAFSFSEASPFFGLASGPVLGVQSLDQARLIFTKDTILSLSGQGPDDIGGGELEPPVEIPTPFGLYNPWSFLKGPDGLWFQMGDSKLFRIPRGGGAPEWVGIDVEDTLLQFTNITGACKHLADNAGIFACNESVPNARVLVFDFRTQTWLLDVMPGDPANIVAVCPHVDGIALVTGDGAVHFNRPTNYAQDDSSAQLALFIPTTLETQPLYPFGLGGYGQVCEMLVTGEVLGDCTLHTRISYDDGQTFTTLDSFDFEGLAYEATFQRKLALPQDITSSLVVEFTVGELSTAPGTTSEGLIINQLDLWVEPEDGLRELAPEHQA